MLPVRARGHEVVAASPQTGVNTITGEGLGEALQGASVVVDVSNSPSFEDSAVMDFFQTSTGNLLKAARQANVKHYVALSIVGTDRLPGSGYLRAKNAQEDLIRKSLKIAARINYSLQCYIEGLIIFGKILRGDFRELLHIRFSGG